LVIIKTVALYSAYNYVVFCLFFLIMFALGVLAGWSVGVSWVCHTDILTSTTINESILVQCQMFKKELFLKTI